MAEVLVCSICSCEFDIEAEGGVTGDLGIIPVSLCPTCFAGMFDLVSQFCEECIEGREREMNG